MQRQQAVGELATSTTGHQNQKHSQTLWNRVFGLTEEQKMVAPFVEGDIVEVKNPAKKFRTEDKTVTCLELDGQVVTGIGYVRMIEGSESERGSCGWMIRLADYPNIVFAADNFNRQTKKKGVVHQLN